MGTRELLILILGLAVVAVILRGLYVAIHARRRQIRLAIDRNIPQDIDLEELELAELPSGGARVVKRSLASVNQQNALQNELDLGSGEDSDEEAVPILLDTVEIRRQKAAGTGSGKPAKAVPSAAAEQIDDDRDPVREHDSSETWIIRDGQEVAGREDQEYQDPQEEQWGDLDADFPQDRLAAAQSDDDDITASQAESDGDYQDDHHEDYPDDYRDTAAGSHEQDDDLSRDYDYADQEDVDESAQQDADEDDWLSASGRPALDAEDEQERQEPRLDLDEDLDSFDDFSMTAGDRIGAPESNAPVGARRISAGTSDTEQRKGKLFARFGKKDAPNTSRRYQEEYGADYDDQDDPLFAPAGRSGAREAARAADQRQQATASERKIQQDREVAPVRQAAAEVQVEARPDSAGQASRARQRAPSEHNGVTDFNQARESRRPAGTGSGQNNAATATTASTSRHSFEPSEVLVVNVMSREGEMFHGPELLQVLLAAGLKHGDMNIFHRQLGSRTDSPIVFSVANILNPGTFDLESMEDFATRGISLFLAMPAVISNREAFDDMLRTAQQIRAALGGELRDDHRSVMTAQTIEHYRQRIQDYELRKLKAAQAQS